MPETKESSPAEIERERWEEQTLEPALSKHPERKKSFQTVSLEEVERLYTPADVAHVDFSEDISFPGEFPYTRGIHPTGYRGRLWTMRQFAGFSSPEETNRRFKYLMKQGQTGLSVAYDLPALMGLDADSPLSGLRTAVLAVRGRCNVLRLDQIPGTADISMDAEGDAR